jgi:hypothetical protein
LIQKLLVSISDLTYRSNSYLAVFWILQINIVAKILNVTVVFNMRWRLKRTLSTWSSIFCSFSLWLGRHNRLLLFRVLVKREWEHRLIFLSLFPSIFILFLFLTLYTVPFNFFLSDNFFAQIVFNKHYLGLLQKRNLFSGLSWSFINTRNFFAKHFGS